jgi:hypothetical protein
MEGTGIRALVPSFFCARILLKVRKDVLRRPHRKVRPSNVCRWNSPSWPASVYHAAQLQIEIIGPAVIVIRYCAKRKLDIK